MSKITVVTAASTKHSPQSEFKSLANNLSDKMRSLSISLKSIKTPSTQTQPMSNNCPTPKAPPLGEIIEINKRIQVLQKRKSYILKFHAKPDSNRDVLHNHQYQNEQFNYKLIMQSHRNWHYFIGQVLNNQFNGIGTLHFDEYRAHGHFKDGNADGRVTIFYKDQIKLIAIYSKGTLLNIILQK